MSFYVDASEQREKARRAEARLWEHSQRRPVNPNAPSLSEIDSGDALPPVFRRPDEGYEQVRTISADKRAARFRDQDVYGPPPPLPVHPDAIPRALPPPRFLVPQHLANQGIVNDPRYAVASSRDPAIYGVPPASGGHTGAGSSPSEPGEGMGRVTSEPFPTNLPARISPSPPDYLNSPQIQQARQELLAPVPLPPEIEQHIIHPDVASLINDTSRDGVNPTYGLTPSQKKRLRRKKAKQNRPASPAPYPLQQDIRPTPPQLNGAVDYTNGSVPPPTARTTCGFEAVVLLPSPSRWSMCEHRLVCPLTPFPHPGQPHLLQLQSARDDGTEIFIGFWLKGE